MDYFCNRGFPCFPNDITPMGIDSQRTPEKLFSNLLGAQSFLNKFNDPEFGIRKNNAGRKEFFIRESENLRIMSQYNNEILYEFFQSRKYR